MVKANNTIFQFYLAMMDFFGKYLSKKYPENNSIEDTKHYQTIIIERIVRMFYSLELLTQNTLDEVSARCVLRGILDSITTYSFIYQRSDKEEMLFRHYLYDLDGWKVYQKSVIGISETNEYTQKMEDLCNDVIRHLEDKLCLHPFYKQNGVNAKEIIHNAKWNYESLQNPRSIKYGKMYAYVGFNSKLTKYFQGYLSQFVHGLCFSNKQTNSEMLKSVLYESIILADKFIQTICHTFNDKEMVEQFRDSDIIQKFQKSKGFNFDDLAEFEYTLVRKDKTILI